MNFDPIVEVMFDQVTWTDITRYVRTADRIGITRGRGDEQSDIQPGTMTLKLNNDGRFTPGLATGAYYPNVRKGRRIRARVIAWTKNLITNSSFEAGTTGWAAAGTVPPALAQSATFASHGSQSLRVTWGTGGTGPAAQTVLTGLQIGRTYTASAQVRVPSGGAPHVRLGIVGLATGTASAVTNTFTQITYTFAATSTTHVLQLTPVSSPTSGHQVYLDAVQVEAGAAATTYSSADAVIYPRFEGRVNDWPVEWDGGEDDASIVEITCTDLFKRLGALATMRSLLEEEFLFLAPDAYYTLGETSGSTSAGDTSGQAQESMKIFQVAGAGGTVTFGEADGPGTDDLTAPRFTPFSSSQGKGLRANLRAATGGVVVACWINTTTGGRDFLQVSNRFSGASGAAVVLQATGTGSLKVTAFLGDETLAGDFAPYHSANLIDGNNHLVAVYITSGGSVFINIDGVAGSSGLAYAPLITPDVYDRIAVGGFKDPTGGDSNLFDGVISHVWYKRAGAMPAWSDVWTAGSGDTEATTARFDRLRTLLGIGGTTLGSSTTQIDAQAAGGKTPLQAFQDVAAVEAGLVYASRSADELVLECRNYRYNKASSVTLTASDVARDIRWSDDDQPLLNDFTAKRDGGADQRAIDTASITEYGVSDDSTSQPWASDADALAYAQWRVYLGADPPPRVTQVSIPASTLPGHAQILALDLSDVVTLSGMPAATSPATSAALHIEGYTETIEPGLHTITLNTSPAAPNQVWQLGVAGRSELGITTRLAL